METELVTIIREEIHRAGQISFARFMELALYHPEHGYYSCGRAAIGRRGDYITNVSVGPLFGRLLAAQFIEIRECLGTSDNFSMIEQGAHDGQFAFDVLTSIRKSAPQIFEALRYRIVEPFPALREKQTETLEGRASSRPTDRGTTQRSSLQKPFDNVSWSNSLVEVQPFTGIHFSNELLDAMPVDMRGKSVALKDDHFVFAEQTSDHHSAPNASQLSWIDDLAMKLQCGVAIIIDYGFVRSQFHEVVQARSHHRLLDSPFEQVGQADISVHLNWTDIAERAQQQGFEIAGFTDQHHFITGIISQSGTGQSPLPLDSKHTRELQTLLHPEMLGRAFQVLALSKGLDLRQPLAGFRFARDPSNALELEQ